MLTKQKPIQQSMPFQVAVDASRTGQNAAMAVLTGCIEAEFIAKFIQRFWLDQDVRDAVLQAESATNRHYH
jgi:hypothetical protein